MAEESNQLKAETAKIRHDIDRTRERMSGTLDQIQDRLRPRRLLEDVKSRARDATVAKVRRVTSQAASSAGYAARRAQASGIVIANRLKAHPAPSLALLSGALSVAAYLTTRRRRTTTRGPVATLVAGTRDDGGESREDGRRGWSSPQGGGSSRRPNVREWADRHAFAVGTAVTALGIVIGLAQRSRAAAARHDAAAR